MVHYQLYNNNNNNNTVAGNKVTKYAHLATTHMFVPISVETGGSWNVQAVEFVQDLGKLISEVTNEPLETQYLFQQAMPCCAFVSSSDRQFMHKVWMDLTFSLEKQKPLPCFTGCP